MTDAPRASASRMPGSDARMRVSSVIRPSSSCGTLRSARMNTRLPATSISERRRKEVMSGARWTGFGDAGTRYAAGRVNSQPRSASAASIQATSSAER